MTILFQPNAGYLILAKPEEGKLILPDHVKNSEAVEWEVLVSHSMNDYQAGDTIILIDGTKVFNISLPTTEGRKQFCTVEDRSVFGKILKEDVTI